LDQLQKQLEWDARDADLLIGTSGGAVLAALLASGISVDRMMDSQRGIATDCHWNHDTDSGGAFPPVPAWSFPMVSLLKRGLRGELSPLTALCGVLPAGRTDMRGFTRLIDSVVPAGEWAPHPAAWMMAVDAHTGKRVALGRDDAPQSALNQAVCASYAVPACCPPVTIAGRTFVDGGVVSPTSADFVLDADIDEAIVLAPFASTHPDRTTSPLQWIERRVRRIMTGIVDREVALLQQAGIRVIRLEPGPQDLRAIGFNMLDPRRRVRVFETALGTAEAAVRRALSA
jgi:NTE family protein